MCMGVNSGKTWVTSCFTVENAFYKVYVSGPGYPYLGKRISIIISWRYNILTNGWSHSCFIKLKGLTRNKILKWAVYPSQYSSIIVFEIQMTISRNIQCHAFARNFPIIARRAFPRQLITCPRNVSLQNFSCYVSYENSYSYCETIAAWKEHLHSAHQISYEMKRGRGENPYKNYFQRPNTT